MLFNAQNDGFESLGLSYDVCIVGSGFAGITIARELAAQGKKVALLEAGSDEVTDDSQEIYEGETITGDRLQYWGLEFCRQRYFGGTSNHWAGLCIPFDDVDFEQRDIYELPNWPISKSEFDQFFNRAADIIDIKGQSSAAPKNDRWQNSKMRIVGEVASPPTRLNEKYLSEISAAKNIDLILNCNLVDIQLSGNLSHVEKIVTKNYRNEKFIFNAKHFVIACGAVENARLLLNSDSQISSGIGNHSDLVGRCFMEHLNVPMGQFVGDAAFWGSDRKLFKPTREFILQQRIGNSVLELTPDSQPLTYGRLRLLKRIVRDAVCSSDTLVSMSRQVSNVIYCPGDGQVLTLCEQMPNLNSRVTLGKEKDALGLRRVILDWQINDQDRKTVRTLAMTMAKEMARQDVGRVQLEEFVTDPDGEIVAGGHCHQMGTTRMSENPDHGVVDPDSRVHGMENLYIAGSSVFPTGGGNSPTLAIVQLSLRLADHLMQS